MANAIYGKGREAFGNAGVNWTSDAIHVDLLDSADYTVSINADQFHSTTTVPTAARVATFGPLTSKANVLGTLDAADVTFSTVTGDQSELLVIWKNTGTDATSPLLFLFDTATGLPVLPNGGNITVAWDNGTNKIATI
jgi:hypothetical protein